METIIYSVQFFDNRFWQEAQSFSDYEDAKAKMDYNHKHSGTPYRIVKKEIKEEVIEYRAEDYKIY